MKTDMPELVPSLKKLRELMAAFTAAADAAASGDTNRIEESERRRAELEVAVAMVGNYIVPRHLRIGDCAENRIWAGTIEELIMKIEIFKGGNGQYYFHVKGANGEKIAQSEGYTKKQSAVDTIAAMKRELASVTVVEIP